MYITKMIKFHANMMSTIMEKELTEGECMMKNGDTRRIESLSGIEVGNMVKWSNIEGEDSLLCGMAMMRSSLGKCIKVRKRCMIGRLWGGDS